MHFLLLTIFIFQVDNVYAQTGNWTLSSKGLPVYNYTGKLPFSAVDKEVKDAMLPNDPYFLLGNYRMTLITHASGIYQLLTAERTWARINASEQPNYGRSDAGIGFKNNHSNKKILLTGLNSIATNPANVEKNFGVGFARYTYKLQNDVVCTRIISVKPSAKINTGNPAFVVTVILTNNGSKKQELVYDERMLVNFVMNGTQFTEKQKRPLVYHSKINVDANKQSAVADLSCSANTFLTFPAKNERYIYDISPPSLFMFSKNKGNGITSVVKANNDTFSAEMNTSINPGETKSFNIVIGLRDPKNFSNVQQQVDDLFLNAASDNPLDGLYASQWKNKLPDLSAEPDEVLKREMLWNAHMIEASAKYSEYYKETFIPQGTVYSYHFGNNISNRDHLQAALPACYTNPELAKSCIRFVIKHSEVDGEIRRGDAGYGYTPPSIYQESDEQLYFFNTIAEYLLITKDYKFLNEKISYYPAEYGKSDAVLNVLKKYFIYLRDEIGLGYQ